MPDTPRELIILGITESGSVFRPSDWAERLCGVMTLFDPTHDIGFSPYVRPIVSHGVKCVLVDSRVEQLEPSAFDFLLGFARDNELKVRRGRDEARPEAAAAPDTPPLEEEKGRAV